MIKNWTLIIKKLDTNDKKLDTNNKKLDLNNKKLDTNNKKLDTNNKKSDPNNKKNIILAGLAPHTKVAARLAIPSSFKLGLKDLK